MRILLLLLVVISVPAFAQTKKELQNKVDKQSSTIDSLQKIVDNHTNIIENRDRSVKLAREHSEEMKAESAQVRQKMRLVEQENARLLKQTQVGSAKLMTLSNKRSIIKVEEGKFITINQIMCAYSAGFSTDSLGRPVTEEIHIFIKSLNGEQLTDIAAKKYGPQLYSSLHPEHSIGFPLLLSGGNSIAIILLKGPLNNLQPYDGVAHCTLTEK
jgi:hypothetical protein